MEQDLITELAGLSGVGSVSIPDLSDSATYLLGCRNFSQFCCTVRALIKPEAFCPFCENELARRNRKPEQVVNGWQLLENEFRHRNTSQMWLIVPIDHRTSLGEIGPWDMGAVGKLLEYCNEHLGITGGGVVMRFGKPQLHAGTIPHLHLNVIAPVQGKEYRPPLAKDMDELVQDYERLLGFRNDLIEAGGEGWLFSERGIKETQPAVG